MSQTEICDLRMVLIERFKAEKQNIKIPIVAKHTQTVTKVMKDH
jgi:hypothetical protein